MGAGMIAPADLVRGKLIGTGGFGSVFEVLHKPSGQTFAMKIVPRCSLSEREVRCTYANAVPVHACFADATDVHIVMPFYRLGDLTGAGALSESMARCVAAQVADCLAGMHADGYVHRDVKRQNVLRDDSFEVTGRVAMADFGIVTHVTQATTQGRGTLDYMAPEVGMSEERERRLTTACDIFSLGVLLVAMALGREPRMRLGPPPFSMLPPTSVSCVCFRIRCAARVFESGILTPARPTTGGGRVFGVGGDRVGAVRDAAADRRRGDADEPRVHRHHARGAPARPGAAAGGGGHCAVAAQRAARAHADPSCGRGGAASVATAGRAARRRRSPEHAACRAAPFWSPTRSASGHCRPPPQSRGFVADVRISTPRW